MTLVTPVPPDLAAVVVHGPATTSLTPILWDLGFRPVAGTTGPTLWLPVRALDPETSE
jgi:hypothetical protein